jgi:hypothetical protein
MIADHLRRSAARPAYLLVLLFAGCPAIAQVELSGTWSQLTHEDKAERGTGPEISDYTGIPLNEAARMRAETWDADKWTVPEHQCEPHPVDYAPHGPANLRTWSEVDPESQRVVAWHMTHAWMITTRSIWMDGRPHPSPNSRHTWMGFSTGEWHGDILEVKTTHMKEGWIRRNGVPRSDTAHLTEFFIRHGSYLTLVSVVEDPVYLTEPEIRSWNWVLNLGYQLAPYPCSYRVETPRPEGFVAHWLPGTNPQTGDFAKAHHLPAIVGAGGAKTLYPEYRHELAKLMAEGARAEPGKVPPANGAPAKGPAPAKDAAPGAQK